MLSASFSQQIDYCSRWRRWLWRRRRRLRCGLPSLIPYFDGHIHLLASEQRNVFCRRRRLWWFVICGAAEVAIWGTSLTTSVGRWRPRRWRPGRWRPWRCALAPVLLDPVTRLHPELIRLQVMGATIRAATSRVAAVAMVAIKQIPQQCQDEKDLSGKIKPGAAGHGRPCLGRMRALGFSGRARGARLHRLCLASSKICCGTRWLKCPWRQV